MLRRRAGLARGETWSGQPSFRSFEPPEGDAYVHQQVGDHGPRIHLDFEVADVAREAERLRGPGAVVGDRKSQCQVLESPGGLPFCLLECRPRTQVHEPPLARSGPNPTRARLRD